MHPQLMEAIFFSASELNGERVTSILDSRAKRVTYSKVVAALAWLLKTRYLTEQGKITDEFRLLIAQYEASFFERPNDTKRADEIMEGRRLYAASLQQRVASASEHDGIYNTEGVESAEPKITYLDGPIFIDEPPLPGLTTLSIEDLLDDQDEDEEVDEEDEDDGEDYFEAGERVEFTETVIRPGPDSRPKPKPKPRQP